MSTQKDYRMGLVPLGISMNSWTRSIDPKSKNRSTPMQPSTFLNDSGSNLFHRVNSSGPQANKTSLSSKVSQKIVSPVSQILEQTKEKEKLIDAPDDTNISLNFSASSTPLKKRKKSKIKITSSRMLQKNKSTIKRLQKKRNIQSASKRSAVKKPISKKGKKKS